MCIRLIVSGFELLGTVDRLENKSPLALRTFSARLGKEQVVGRGCFHRRELQDLRFKSQESQRSEGRARCFDDPPNTFNYRQPPRSFSTLSKCQSNFHLAQSRCCDGRNEYAPGVRPAGACASERHAAVAKKKGIV